MSDLTLEGFTVRRPTMDDVQIAFELTELAEKYDQGVPETTLNDLRIGWQHPSVNLETDAWLVFTPDGQLVGRADISDRAPVMMYSHAYIHPDYRGRGIGTYLLKVQEDRARQSISKAPEGARVTLNKGTISTNQDAKKLYEENGFKLVRHFYTMEIDMEKEPPQPQLPPHIKIRRFENEMARAVYEADEEAFQDHWGHIAGTFEDWAHWFLKDEEFDPTLWFLAMDGDQIAAITLGEKGGPRTGWINAVATRRPWRGQGIAMALLQTAFGEFYRRGTHSVGLGVDASSLTGATRLYERAGMHVARQYDRYQKELRPGVELSTQEL